MSWRPEDERLLTRLEDEALFDRIWCALAPPDATPPHPRASGVLVGLRGDDDGGELLASAERGHVAPVLARLAAPVLDALEPAQAHHLALLWERVARALESGHQAGATRARRRSIAMWCWLAHEGDYLRGLADRVIDGALDGAQVARAAEEAPLAPLDALGARARDGAESVDAESAAALAALAEVDAACADARVEGEVARSFAQRATRHRQDAIDAAIAKVDTALEQAIIEAARSSEIARLTRSAVEVWRWAGRDEQVERFLVQRLTPVIWERYRDRAWDEVAGLLDPLGAPVESLARRIEADRTKLAYAAPCAQMFVFMAEVAPQLERQLALAERAVALCETHRNGRLVLADLLVERGLRRLDGAVPFGFGGATEQAARDVRRAAELFPQLKRLPAAKARLRQRGVDLDGE